MKLEKFIYATYGLSILCAFLTGLSTFLIPNYIPLFIFGGAMSVFGILMICGITYDFIR